MASTSSFPAQFDLSTAGELLINLPVAELVAHAVRSGDRLASNGALVALTGKYTGRTPKDKVTVRLPGSEEHIWWENNSSLDPATFSALLEKAEQYIEGTRLYVSDAYGGADPEQRINVRV
ncbi:MAG TPA: phosphoenolpyruvate carboxykinase (ATP), partial [Fimbriimonadaceae bacterium]|nr:phosphoenolpyruvate carboxykinase (ATP) [Fimbriimonadaceae bacterium]